MFGDSSLLDKAKAITSEDREKSYGHPLVNFLKEALVRSILSGQVVTPVDIVFEKYITKIVRESNTFTPDNHLDLAGYAATLDRCDRLMRDMGYKCGIDEFIGWSHWLTAVSFMVEILGEAQDTLKARQGQEALKDDV